MDKLINPSINELMHDGKLNEDACTHERMHDKGMNECMKECMNERTTEQMNA